MHQGVLTRIKTVPDCRFRLLVLHHAGGTAQAYRSWVRHFPQDWEICLLQAPGRDSSAHLEPFREARALARHLAASTDDLRDRPYGLFGHSMGALVAHELAHHLLADPAEADPAWLGVSAWSPAHGPERDAPRHLRSDAELREIVAGMGGTPRSSLADPDQWARIAPVVRADLNLVDTWRPDPARPPLRLPLSVLGGADDPGMPPSRMAAWREHADGPVVHHTLPGDHFYFVGRTREVVARIVTDIRAAVPTGVRD
ncbi:thioesterase [Nocardiopsis kunsanensis]|uniref:Thioesterase n=1 Tax=Nocardiopsis kunsanensis TaxID=141693 RepID=A0A919CH01_9ACTN|nr:thioesterase domain-containing protein [Nocardiopsis kunsanensis]GHD20091.1 thioesterase [Nocardiopsis kunsanensis]